MSIYMPPRKSLTRRKECQHFIKQSTRLDRIHTVFETMLTKKARPTAALRLPLLDYYFFPSDLTGLGAGFLSPAPVVGFEPSGRSGRSAPG